MKVKASPGSSRRLATLVLSLLLPLAASCGTLEIGIEGTVTPDQATTENVHLAEPTTTLSVTPTPVSPGETGPTMTLTSPPPGLVYWTDDALWKVNVDRQPVPIFSPGGDQAQYSSWQMSVRISPNGDQILYNDWETNDLWLADLSTGLRRNLTNTPDASEGFFRWWPGRLDTVLFGSLPSELAPEPGWTGFLGVVGIGGESHRILDDQHHIGGPLAPSPDGQTIAYGGGSTARLYHWETGLETFDPADYGLTAAEGSLGIGSPAWSPDGKQLAWIVEGEGLSADGRIGIVMFDLEAQTARLLHSYNPAGLEGWLPTPIWGPDGHLNIDGPLAAPLWSPDGHWLAFVTLAQNPVESILWVLQADGQGEERIPLAIGRVDSLAWSPDGCRLIFTHTAEDLETSTRMVEVDTGFRHQVDLPSDAVVVDWLEVNLTSAPSVSATEPAPVMPPPTSTPVPAPTGTPVPISILSFDASPAEIWPGDPVTLTWNVVAEWAAIYSLDSEGRLSEPWFTVPLSGTLVVTTNASLRNRARFVLFAGSGDSREQAMALVNITCPDEWFFSNPPADCPGPPHHTTIVAERFERGLMLWLEAAGEIHIFNEIVILYDDDAASPRWRMMIDGWSPGTPEQDPDIVPPPGYYEPVRGFGKVWREVPGVRDRLGWAIEEEFVVGDGAFQCTWGRYARCYLTGPDGAIYVLEPEMSGWFVVE